MSIKESLYSDDLEYEIVESAPQKNVPSNSSSRREVGGYNGFGSSIANTADAIASNSARAIESINSTIGNSIVSYNQRMTIEHTNKKDVVMAAMGDDPENNAYIADRFINGKEIEKTKRMAMKLSVKKEIQLQRSADKRDVQIRRSDNSLEKIRLKQEGKTVRTSYVTNSFSSFAEKIDFDELNGIKKK